MSSSSEFEFNTLAVGGNAEPEDYDTLDDDDEYEETEEEEEEPDSTTLTANGDHHDTQTNRSVIASTAVDAAHSTNENTAGYDGNNTIQQFANPTAPSKHNENENILNATTSPSSTSPPPLSTRSGGSTKVLDTEDITAPSTKVDTFDPSQYRQGHSTAGEFDEHPNAAAAAMASLATVIRDENPRHPASSPAATSPISKGHSSAASTPATASNVTTPVNAIPPSATEQPQQGSVTTKDTVQAFADKHRGDMFEFHEDTEVIDNVHGNGDAFTDKGTPHTDEALHDPMLVHNDVAGEDLLNIQHQQQQQQEPSSTPTTPSLGGTAGENHPSERETTTTVPPAPPQSRQRHGSFADQFLNSNGAFQLNAYDGENSSSSSGLPRPDPTAAVTTPRTAAAGPVSPSLETFTPPPQPIANPTTDNINSINSVGPMDVAIPPAIAASSSPPPASSPSPAPPQVSPRPFDPDSARVAASSAAIESDEFQSGVEDVVAHASECERESRERQRLDLEAATTVPPLVVVDPGSEESDEEAAQRRQARRDARLKKMFPPLRSRSAESDAWDGDNEDLSDEDHHASNLDELLVGTATEEEHGRDGADFEEWDGRDSSNSPQPPMVAPTVDRAAEVHFKKPSPEYEESNRRHRELQEQLLREQEERTASATRAASMASEAATAAQEKNASLQAVVESQQRLIESQAAEMARLSDAMHGLQHNLSVAMSKGMMAPRPQVDISAQEIAFPYFQQRQQSMLDANSGIYGDGGTGLQQQQQQQQQYSYNHIQHHLEHTATLTNPNASRTVADERSASSASPPQSHADPNRTGMSNSSTKSATGSRKAVGDRALHYKRELVTFYTTIFNVKAPAVVDPVTGHVIMQADANALPSFMMDTTVTTGNGVSMMNTSGLHPGSARLLKEKLDGIDDLLQMFLGYEDDLFKLLRAKYQSPHYEFIHF